MWNNPGVPAISHHFAKVEKSSLYPVLGSYASEPSEDSERVLDFPDASHYAFTVYLTLHNYHAFMYKKCMQWINLFILKLYEKVCTKS